MLLENTVEANPSSYKVSGAADLDYLVLEIEETRNPRLNAIRVELQLRFKNRTSSHLEGNIRPEYAKDSGATT